MNTTKEQIPEIFISPSDFDPARLVLHDPETSSFTMGQTEISTTLAPARYLDDEDNECLFYFSAPAQACFGVNYIYDIGIDESQQTPENAKGFQIAYPLTSMKTVSKPTEEEKAYEDMLNALWQAAVDQGREQAELDDSECLIPDSAVSSFISAEKKGNWERAVKKPAEHPKDKDKKSLDLTKPKRQYVKLFSSGKGENLKADTPFYGPGNELCNAVKFISKRGIIEPCFFFEGVYYGSHGPRAPHGASLRFKLAEANFTETSISQGLPSKRLLPRNNSKASSHDEDEDEDAGCDEGTFSKPGEDTKLSKVAKSKGAKKAIAKKATVKKAAVKKDSAKKATVKKAAVKKDVAKKAATKKATVKKVKKPEPEEDVEEEDMDVDVENDSEE